MSIIPLDIGSISITHIFLGIIFILFVLSIKKLKKIVFNSLLIAVAAVLFPIIMNAVFGFPLSIDGTSIIFYMTVGLGAYFLYLFSKAVYVALSVTEKAASPITRMLKGTSAKKREAKIDKIIKEKESDDRMKKIIKDQEKRKQKPKPDNDYVELKDDDEEDAGNENIIRGSK